ncbi:hypothetical protein [Thermococcus sp. 9N3]|uniref:hypothetical protein n=1 Tax=Thermococcus sp. 9N3 TaxID=163002 RepID=UPI003211E017
MNVKVLTNTLAFMFGEKMSYFLISVATMENLEKCTQMNVAGFTSSVNGYWAFVDIDVGDYVSFLHGAKVYNLYRVKKKVAIENPDEVGPWEPIKLPSGRVYSFPFRLLLTPLRELSESMIRPEFSYVAENLLLRGGYRKTHFQADEVTLYNVSGMGIPVSEEFQHETSKWKAFMPKITFSRELIDLPRVFPMREVLLQSLLRKAIERNFLDGLLETFKIDRNPEDFEVLGEKALPSGHVDLLIKPKHPLGRAPRILVEVKLGSAGKEDLKQLKAYIKESGPETVGGVLIAKSFKKNIEEEPDIKFWSYGFGNITREATYTYEELFGKIRLEEV